MRRMQSVFLSQRRCAWLVVLAVGLACTLLPAAARGQAGKTLSRTVDPIVITGDKFPTLQGTPIEHLGLFAYDGRLLQPVPFQIDERRDGEYVYQSGPGAAADVDRGRFDADDELAFLAADTGGRLPVLRLPEAATAGVEIGVRDPVDDGRGFVYLLAFAGSAPRSRTDYVTYHVARNEIETTDYVVGYGPQAPISISKLFVKPAAGGSGQSVADRQKIRLEAVSLGNLVHFTRNETDFRAEVVAYTDGPVRVLRRTKNWLVLFWRIPTPSVHLNSVYWKTGMVFPMQLRMPFRVSRFFREARMRLYIDNPPDVLGRRFYNRHNPQGVDLDGRTQEAERRMDRRPSDWQVVAGTRPGHREGWFSRQIYDVKQTGVRLNTYYVDDMQIDDAPERYRGCFGCLGFELDGVQNLSAGVFSIDVHMFPMPSYRLGDETKYLNLLDQPLRLETTPLN
jgi:hypothetical protein